MENFDKKSQQILESFKPIKTVRRMFYPRNFDLSPEFLRAFDGEKKRLLSKGIPEKEIRQKLAKALLFH